VWGGRAAQALGEGEGALSSFAGNAHKNDSVDALATALAASRNERLAAVDPEAASEVLHLLSERRENLVAERARALNRLHGLLRDLLPGGVARTLSADRVARILRSIRPKGTSARLRRRLASEVLRLESGRWRQEDRRPKRAHRSRDRSLGHHPHPDLRHRSHPGRYDHGDGW
jgi:hypothetical protein